MSGDTPRPAPATDWPLVRAWFERLQPLPPAARAAWLAEAELSASVRAEVRSLLAALEDTDLGPSGDFLSAPSRSTVAPEPGREGQTLGPWRITQRLGTGGMGEVWLAQRDDGAYTGEAAIKVLKRGMDSDAVLERFAQEQQALARLNHPHIAHLLDAGRTADGLPYFVMERVLGQPIDSACTGQPLHLRLGLFLQLADAVAHAHRKLLVHRDLKPSNVLVTPEGQVKLLDFGIAKALDPLDDPMEQPLDGKGITQAGERPFTPMYASPEQVRGEPVGTGTDIYSLGMLLYVMLTGVRPYGRQATTPREAARSVLEEAPSRPSGLSPEVVSDPDWLRQRQRLKGDLDNILLKALAKEVDQRYVSVDALKGDVSAFLAGRPVSAQPATWGYLLNKFVRRHRVPVAAAALGVVGLVGGLVIALHQRQQAVDARDRLTRQLAGVKDIANELVFRYGDAIQLIPGGAKTQEAMLRQTVASLDVTLQQAPDDAELNALMAATLGRLAQIQGNSTFSGPERAAEARATVERSLALADKAWALTSHDVRFVNQHLITLLTKANVLRDAGQPAQGLAVLKVAADRAAQTLAGSLSDADRATVLESRANVLVNMAHFNDHSGRPSLGRPEEALRHYREAEAEFQALYGNPALVAAADSANGPGDAPVAEWANHNLANVQSGRSLVHQRMNDFAAMKGELLAAQARREDNLRRNPGNVIWRQSAMQDANYLALAHLQLGEATQALAAAQRAWDLLAERLKADPGSAQWLATRGTFAAQYARALAANGRPAEALPIFELALARVAQLRERGDSAALRERETALQRDKAAAERQSRAAGAGGRPR